MSVLDHFIGYCHLQGLSKKTIKDLRLRMLTFARRFPELFEVTDADAIEFFSRGKKDGFVVQGTPSASTYNNFLNCLNKFYRWAIEAGYTQHNPIQRVPRTKVPRTVPRRLSEDQVIRVLYHAQNFPHTSQFLQARNYAIVATLLMTGLRAQELLNLQKEDVRLEEQLIRVQHGKGDKERFVYFSDELPFILRRYLKEVKRLGKKSDHFFTSYGSNNGLCYKGLQGILRKISQRAGFHFTAHQLRHTCFSMLLEQDVDLGSIQAQAGHASLVSTQIYTKVADKVRKSKIQKVSFLS